MNLNARGFIELTSLTLPLQEYTGVYWTFFQLDLFYKSLCNVYLLYTLPRASGRPGLVCMGGRDGGGYQGEWEHAIALVMACRYLPIQLLASPGERAGTSLVN